MSKTFFHFLFTATLFAANLFAGAADYPPPTEADFVIKDFHFRSGESLAELRTHYRTLGHPKMDAEGKVRNAILVLHGTGGNGSNFLRAEFAGTLFGKGQILDTDRYYIVLPDAIGHGKSSKPSDGLRAHFPKYGYLDMVEVQYRLLTEGLGVNHLRLVIGTSMGGMHTWLWGERHGDFMDALMPLASVPTQISGRNRVWRRIVIDAIRNDPSWENGDYKTEPAALRTALEMSFFMGNNPINRYNEASSLRQADEMLDKSVDASMQSADANDTLFAFEASRDYDPNPDLETIKAPLMAVNSADDLINPPELRVLEKEIKRVPHGRMVMIPLSDKTRGHGTHTLAPLWQEDLKKLLRQSEAK